MLRSMTAYGRAIKESPLGRFLVEIQSVNRKFLEINCLLPKDLLRFDADVKKWVGKEVGRGQVTIKIGMSVDAKQNLLIVPNFPLARALKKAWDEIADDLNLEKTHSFSLEMLNNEVGILQYEENFKDDPLYKEALYEVVHLALQDFVKMKIVEGSNLYHDILARLERLKLLIKQIEAKSPNATEKYRKKLVERLEELLPGAVENEERILREIGLYSEKIDVTEEITRFQSHLNQLMQLIKSEVPSKGKTIEFILQELSREINTIGSKSSDIEVAHLVVEIKSELEKIREQIQNVE